MSEESLTSQDKEELKKRLELLQKEYERTAQRLQRAERREVVRKHVQSRISEQNRLLHINTSVTLGQSSSSSPEQLSNCSGPPETTKVRFHLPGASPFSTLTCTRSPSRSHRLRSKRSLLRLQSREKGSDTEESQEKIREGMEERWREEQREMEGECEWTSEEKKKDLEKGQTEEERKQEEEEKRKEQAEMMKDVLEKNEESLTPENHQSAAESSFVNQSPLTKLLEIHDHPAGQSALRTSPSTSSDNSIQSNGTSGQSCSINNKEKSSEFLTSCTLIEGLPFPVEYYVRTTRRMASAHSSVDLDAVIQSQLSNGRGRRRTSRGRVTSQPLSQKPPEKSVSRRPGRRGRRGRRRTRESDSSGQSESLDQSPCSPLQEESKAIPSPKPSSDPQLHLSCELSTDSHVYPIFRKRCGRASVSRSQISTRIKGSSQLLPSLTSLTQALRTKDFQNLGGLLTVLEVQDFHLPDDEFGQLKLDRLCSSCPNLDSLSCSSRLRKSERTNSPEGGRVEDKKDLLNSLPHASALESLLPLTCPTQSQVEAENTDQSEHEVTSQALNEMEEPVHRSIPDQTEVQQNGEVVEYTQPIKSNDPHKPSASRSLMLNLSMSLTSHTQIDHNSSLITLGATPNLFSISPSSQLTPFLSMPDQAVASHPSEVELKYGTPENLSKESTDLLTSPRVQTQEREVSEHAYSKRYHSESPEMELAPEAEVEIQGRGISDERGVMEVNISTQEKHAEKICTESESFQNEPEKAPDSEDSISGSDFHSQTRGDISNELNVETSGVSANQRPDSEAALSSNLVQTSEAHRDAQSQHVELLSHGSLRKTHTLKALDGGCVLDVCLVRWPSEDWCVCVAGEWSVCVWKQNPGEQQWKLLYTWTFTQSVISLQGIPDSSALICVCLGRLEITEARILHCPSTDSEFSQVELYKGALQAVLAVSDCRVTCCSAPGAHQNLQVFTLTQDGRMAETLSLVSPYETVQTLVMVEREKDALIGWTEHKSFLIWNMKSGQLLQTVRLEESVSTATCLRGYSHRGVLCVLLQQVSVCHEDTAATLFTLVATNPLTGKSLTLKIFSPASSPSERLVDGDVCESALVGVFHSGLTIWNLTGGVACVYANESAETCRLARWAGPNTLLTGYLNGDVHIYQFNPTENISH